jgi:hypothetical protein
MVSELGNKIPLDEPPTTETSTMRVNAIPFPPSFRIYHKKAFTRTYLLGEEHGRPLYALTFHTGASGQPAVVLHVDADSSSPALATLDYEDLRSHMTIILPFAGEATEETMDYRMTFPYLTYFFSIDIGAFGGTRERFEWRHSSGDAVASLEGRKTGWKLVRVPEDSEKSGEDGSRVPVGTGYVTSDGGEVVAALAYVNGKGKETARFGFLGSGSTGSLGERWAIMAVMTALGIFQRDRSGWRR